MSILLDLPYEMLLEVVKHVDHDGLLALRKTNRRAKGVVDEVCKRATIPLIRIRKTMRYGLNYRALAAFECDVDMDSSKPAFVLLPLKRYISRSLDILPRGNVKQYEFFVTIVDWESFLNDFKQNIEQCRLDYFELISTDETFHANFSSFLNGLTIKHRCIDVHNGKWDFTLKTITSLQINAAKILRRSPIADVMKLAEAVDTISMLSAFETMHSVNCALNALSKRCSRFYINRAILSNEAEVLIDKVPKLGKKLYLYALVSEQTTIRKYKANSFDIRVAVENGSKFLEIRHEAMERPNISYFKRIMTSLLDLPNEMLLDIAKYTDDDAFFALRKNECILNGLHCLVEVHSSKTALVLLPLPEFVFAERRGNVKTFSFYVSRRNWESFLNTLKVAIEKCTVDYFELNSKDETLNSLIPSFHKNFPIQHRCLFVHKGDNWDVAANTIVNLQLNTVKVSYFPTFPDLIRISCCVDTFIGFTFNCVVFALQAFSKRCSHIYITNEIPSYEVDMLIDKLPKLEKKLYFYARVPSASTWRQFKRDSFNIRVDYENGKKILEISHQDIARPNISYDI